MAVSKEANEISAEGFNDLKRTGVGHEAKMTDPVRGTPERFALLIGLSLGLHVLALVLVSVFSTADDPGSAAVRRNKRMVSRVAEDLAGEYSRLDKARKPAFDEVSELVSRMYEKLSFSRTLSEEEKSELLAELLDPKGAGETAPAAVRPSDADLDRLIERKAGKGKLALSSGGKATVRRSGGPDGKWNVYKLDGSSEDILAAKPEQAGTPNVRVLEGGESVLVPTASAAPREVPAEYYFRNSPYEAIAAVGAELFTIIREDGKRPSFAERGEAAPNNGPRGGKGKVRTDPAPSAPRIVFLRSRDIGPLGTGAGRPVFAADEAEIRRILDGLMGSAIEDQLAEFRREYLDRYDWDSPALAGLTRDFLFGNMNGIFFVLDDVSAAFDEVEELYHKRPVQDLLSSCAGRFPGTLTDAEIRFYLAASLDFESRVAARLLDPGMGPAAAAAARSGPASAFDPSRKAYVVELVRNDLLRSAGRLDMGPDRVLKWYDALEEDIYVLLAECGGEVRNRALNARGRLLWASGSYEKAFGIWMGMDVTLRNFPGYFWQIRHAVEKGSFRRRAVDEVNGILAAADNKDRYSSLARHMKFHTWKKRSGGGR